MRRPSKQRVIIQIPATKARRMLGLVQLLPVVVVCALGIWAALLEADQGVTFRRMLPEYARAALFCILLGYVSAASAASFLSGRQAVWFEGETLCIKKIVPLQVNPVRRISIDKLRGRHFRVLSYPRDNRSPEYRPPRMPRVVLGDPGLDGTHLAAALTLAEARELANALNAFIVGRPWDSSRDGLFWWIEHVE